jgi:hypothetical protein
MRRMRLRAVGRCDVRRSYGYACVLRDVGRVLILLYMCPHTAMYASTETLHADKTDWADVC